MKQEYDFEMIRRAYAEMARRARERDEARLPRDGLTPPSQAPQPMMGPERRRQPA